MTASGVVAHDDVAHAFNDLKMKKAYRYLIFKLSDDKTKIILDESDKGPRSATYADFIAALPDKESRYGVIDYEYTVGGQEKDRICFVLWSPDSAPIRDKMTVATSKDALMKKLGESCIHRKFQASDKGDLDEDDFRQKCETGH